MNFDLFLFYEGGPVRVTGRITPYSPATGPSMSHAGGDPAEGGEIEDFRVFAEDGIEVEDTYGDILSALEDEIMEKTKEIAESNRADVAEAREKDG